MCEVEVVEEPPGEVNLFLVEDGIELMTPVDVGDDNLSVLVGHYAVKCKIRPLVCSTGRSRGHSLMARQGGGGKDSGISRRERALRDERRKSSGGLLFK